MKAASTLCSGAAAGVINITLKESRKEIAERPI
jgi:hypothetical protein